MCAADAGGISTACLLCLVTCMSLCTGCPCMCGVRLPVAACVPTRVMQDLALCVYLYADESPNHHTHLCGNNIWDVKR